MTMKVTVTPGTPGYAAIVSQSSGAPDTRIENGSSAEFWVHSGNQLTVSETSAAIASTNGGPDPTDPAKTAE